MPRITNGCLLRAFTALGAILVLAGCETRKFVDLYPATYEKPLAREQLYVPKNYSRDVFLSLPSRYKLAAYSRKLLCIKDRDGYTKNMNLGVGKIYKHVYGDRFKQRAARIEGSGNYHLVEFEAHPGVKCYVGKNVQLFDSAWFASWERYLATWQSNELEIISLNETSERLMSEIGDGSSTVAILDQEISRINSEIKAQERQIELLTKEQGELRERLGQAADYAYISTPVNFKFYAAFVSSGRVFNPRLPYDKKNDPWLPEAEKHLEDISSREWAGQLPRGSFLDPELASNLDRMATAWKDPKSAGPEIGGKIQSLKDAGMRSITATSAVRTPWGQATVNSNGNPKGSYVGSAHLTGQGLDISVPFAYNTANHAKLREVAQSFGLKLPVKDDRVHIAMAAPTSTQNARAIAVFSSYYKVSKELKESQKATINGKKEDISKLTEKSEKINKDIKGKRDSLRDRASLFERNSAQIQSLLAENQLLTSEIAEKEERERQEQDRRDDDRPDDGYDDSDRWPDLDDYPDDDDRSSGYGQDQDQDRDRDRDRDQDDYDRGDDGPDLGGLP